MSKHYLQRACDLTDTTGQVLEDCAGLVHSS